MSFDKATRNALARLVVECRRLLTDDIRDQLQRIYGLQPDGTALPIASLQHLDEPGLEIARELRVWQDHLASTEPGTEQKRRMTAFDRLAQETAFTTLNRLAALRLCEERGHILECVRRGKESDGFALYEQLSGGALGSRGETYHLFLQRVFDELGQDLGVLFDRQQPHSLVFPGERCLEEALVLLNDPALRHLWQEDETIGWIYQYYNSQEERRQMREESAAPRNSRELAVRNQFFTPRYVVEFLTDNTLGRIWYEMTKGCTSLKEKCRYLVRRPNEIFLNAGQDSPVTPQEDQTLNKSQEELLKDPVNIPHRPLKDPREIRLLDPACGSMHFGLYAFDLFEDMYKEVWDNHPDLLADLRKAGTNKQEFLVLVPKLIIEHNLHGIEIDPRCTQIAGLSLWLRAQKTWQRLGLKLAERPQISRSHIVCAEPMPGEKELLREFTARLESPAIGQLVEMVFDKMQLAGEAGSLLKIEEEIRSIVTEAKALWNQGPKYEQIKLFSDLAPKPEQQELKLDLSGITDEEFWEKAEERIYTALRDYAEQVQNGSGYQRRLFAEDAAHGFAFVDLCRKRYDVILMNPPFGDSTPSLKTFLERNYSRSRHDLAACMFSRSIAISGEDAKIGIIAAANVWYSSYLRNWRDRELLGLTDLQVAAHLGGHILDGATIRTACWVSSKQSRMVVPAWFFRLIFSENKEDTLLRAVIDGSNGCPPACLHIANTHNFKKFDLRPIAYWTTKRLLDLLESCSPLEPMFGTCRVGLQTNADERVLRLWSEVPQSELGSGKKWVFYAKGGDFAPYFGDIHLVVLWEDDAKEMRAMEEARVTDGGNSRGNSALGTHDFYLRAGFTYTERTNKPFAPRVLPAGCIFATKGPAILPRNREDKPPKWLLGVMNSRFARFFLGLSLGSSEASGGEGASDYKVGLIKTLPVFSFTPSVAKELDELVEQALKNRAAVLVADPTVILWSCLRLNGWPSIDLALQEVSRQNLEHDIKFMDINAAINRHIESVYGLTHEEEKSFEEELGPMVTEDTKLVQGKGDPNRGQTLLERKVIELGGIVRNALSSGDAHRWYANSIRSGFSSELVEVFVGFAFGRWDIRFAIGAKPAPELPAPFASLPVCPPGMLQNEHGLPAAPSHVPDTYPLRISWPGVLVDDPNHPEDIECRIRGILEVIWKERAEAIEHEACEILCVRSLREYFSKPNKFFANHLKRYSKSRRQAPIYWPLSTASGSYTIWVYYHRLNDDFLYKAVNDYVNPKITEGERRLTQVETDLPRATGRDATTLREAFEETKSLMAELQDFKTELLRVAALPYKPNLNDGVPITAAPLWKLFRLPKWRNDLKKCWEQLEAGDYDWAHLAYSIWPERVQEKCKGDRSLAIAHGLEHLCETKPSAESSGARRKRKAKAAMQGKS